MDEDEWWKQKMQTMRGIARKSPKSIIKFELHPQKGFWCISVKKRDKVSEK